MNFSQLDEATWVATLTGGARLERMATAMANRFSTTLRAELKAVAEVLPDTTLTLVVAPGGSGKTTLARHWREARARGPSPIAWLALAELHSDLSIFLQDMVQAIRALPFAETDPPKQTVSPSEDNPGPGTRYFGESIERLLSLHSQVDPAQMIRRLNIELRALPSPPILCLDGYEHLPNGSPSAAIVDGLLRLDPSPIRLVLTSRGSRPPAATLLLASGDALEIDAEALNLRTAQVADVLLAADIEPDPALVAGLLGQTKGWAMAVRLMARRLETIPADRRLEAVR